MTPMDRFSAGEGLEESPPQPVVRTRNKDSTIKKTWRRLFLKM
jgi:hypothetical protein